MKKNSFIFLLALAAAFVSCNKEMSIEEPSSSEIRFAAENASFTVEAQTKASTGTSEVTSLGSFKVAATTGAAGSETSTWNNVSFSGSGDYTGGKTWPASNPSYNFYATNRSGDAPMTFNASGTTISATNTQDVVCAYLPSASVTYKAKNTLSFEHIFARISTVTVAQESGYTVSSVNIKITPKTGGTYNLRTGAGATDATGWSSLTTGEAVTIASTTGANSNDVWLVPGTYTITAGWVASQAGGSSVTYSGKTVDVVITRGKRNAITATLGGEMVFGVSVEEFDDNEVPLSFGLHQSSSGEHFSYAGGTENVTFSGYSGTWSVSYSTDGGSSYSGSAPSGVSVSRTSANQGEQVYAISLSAASPSSSGVTLNAAWPSDSRHTTPIGTPASPVDLSLLDIHGDVMAGGRTTANTYVVHAPGTYMIPLVYGNAITNGVANTQAYISPKSGSAIVANFKNAYDTNISSPYIETDVAANSKSVASASLTWADKANLISVNSALETHGGIKYLVFNIPSATIGYGNAVVSVKDNSGNVVWSWLVWVTGHELWDERIEARVTPSTSEVFFLSEGIGTVPPNGTGNIYSAFNCIVKFSTAGGQDLFYTISRDEARVYTSYSGATITPWYQFGRPTPHPSNAGAVEGTYTVSDGNQVSSGTMLQHPEMFFKRGASPYNWCSDNSSQFYNIWNNNQTSADQNVDVIKTVYDPCPAGYAMPRRNDFTYFTTDGGNHGTEYNYFNVIDWNHDSTISSADFTYGWHMKRTASDNVGIYFPAAGYRSSGDGALYSVGGYGYWWSSCPYSAGGSRRLYFDSGNLYPLYSNGRATGFSVRPARIQ